MNYFAKIKFALEYKDIKVKLNFIKNEKYALWYIKKFNPYSIEEINIFGQVGYNITLPLTKKMAEENEEIFDYILERTISELKDFDVNIIYCEENIVFTDLLPITISSGKNVMTYFVKEILEKIIKSLNLSIQKIEVLIIGNSHVQNKLIVEQIYKELNFLNIIDDNYHIIEYNKTLELIFEEFGLNINICADNKKCISNADVIINCNDNCVQNYLYYKADAIIIDLSGQKYNQLELFEKRKDIIVINGISIKYFEQFVRMEDFELFLYENNKFFKKYIDRLQNIDEENEVDYFCILDYLKTNGYKVSSLISGKQTLNTGFYTNFGKKMCKNKS